jgi:hypothetical protein
MGADCARAGCGHAEVRHHPKRCDVAMCTCPEFKEPE